MTLAPDFTCDYGSQITVSAGTNVTIRGNGAVLDAAKKGRFFSVTSGAALALDHLVLQNGFADRVSQQRKKPSLTLPFARNMLEIPANGLAAPGI
jgi:hypothetical protein